MFHNLCLPQEFASNGFLVRDSGHASSSPFSEPMILKDEIQSGVRAARPNTPGSPGAVAAPVQQPSNQFSVEELEMIFDCLLDFIAIPGFIPSLYASFDCDATKPDTVKPMFQYLGKCSRSALRSAPPPWPDNSILPVTS
jgi:hypothetical protein